MRVLNVPFRVHVENQGVKATLGASIKPLCKRLKRSRLVVRVNEVFIGVDCQAPVPVTVSGSKGIQPIRTKAGLAIRR